MGQMWCQWGLNVCLGCRPGAPPSCPHPALTSLRTTFMIRPGAPRNLLPTSPPVPGAGRGKDPGETICGGEGRGWNPLRRSGGRRGVGTFQATKRLLFGRCHVWAAEERGDVSQPLLRQSEFYKQYTCSSMTGSSTRSSTTGSSTPVVVRPVVAVHR